MVCGRKSLGGPADHAERRRRVCGFIPAEVLPAGELSALWSWSWPGARICQTGLSSATTVRRPAAKLGLVLFCVVGVVCGGKSWGDPQTTQKDAEGCAGSVQGDRDAGWVFSRWFLVLARRSYLPNGLKFCHHRLPTSRKAGLHSYLCSRRGLRAKEFGVARRARRGTQKVRGSRKKRRWRRQRWGRTQGSYRTSSALRLCG